MAGKHAKVIEADVPTKAGSPKVRAAEAAREVQDHRSHRARHGADEEG